MMKYLAAFLAAVVFSPALAADLPTKAAAALPVVSCTVAACSGWYIGGQVEGAGPIATGQADLTDGVGLGAHIGYQLWNGNWFAAAEVGATGYIGASTFTPAVGGPSVSPGSYSIDYAAHLGYGLQGLLNTGPAATPSQGLFANLAASLLSPYAIVGGRTRQFGTGFVSGAGIEYTIGNGWNVAVEYLHVNYDTTVGNVPIGTENDAIIKINRMF
jgi:opacity protein-like surface antigen